MPTKKKINENTAINSDSSNNNNNNNSPKQNSKLYQWENFIDDQEPKKEISKWTSKFGPVVKKRDESGIAVQVEFRVLIDNPETEIYLVGKFNNWGANPKEIKKWKLKHDANSIFATIITDEIAHKEQYKFLVKIKEKFTFMQDPASVYFDDEGNSIFWDYEDPTTVKPTNKFINTIERSTRIIQTDLPGLIMHWKSEDNEFGKDIPSKRYYQFIARSGILEHVKSLGFNTIQFLPFAQSIDGDNWKYRYLVPFQFAIQKNWGTPDDFIEMINKCHELDIAVIGDFIISHLPFKDYKVFNYDCEENGVHLWENRHKTKLFMKEETPWGTMRIDYDNVYVRRFIVSSCLHFLKYYNIDGFRIDNVDGLIRYGPNGDGEERPNGRVFLRELTKTLYEYNPFALLHFESHYFFEDNAKMLVVPHETDPRALGATCYNSSRITYYFHTDYMPKSITDVSVWKIKDIISEKEWGQSNSTIADFHNHDAAAGLIEMRCTGSYAYDAMTCKQPENHIHALGKIKVMEAIISFGCEGRTLDLIQTFLLQTGTFEHESAIEWSLVFNQVSNNTVNYKAKINQIMDDPAFWPMFTKNRKVLNVDETNKIIVFERSSEYKGKKTKFIIIINMSSWLHHFYRVGITENSDYEVILNSDLYDYAGTGRVSYENILKNYPSKNFEFFEREIILNTIAPYGVVVLKKV